jgi:hypothetical protein
MMLGSNSTNFATLLIVRVRSTCMSRGDDRKPQQITLYSSPSTAHLLQVTFAGVGFVTWLDRVDTVQQTLQFVGRHCVCLSDR